MSVAWLFLICANASRALYHVLLLLLQNKGFNNEDYCFGRQFQWDSFKDVFCKFKKVLKRIQHYYSFSCLENMTWKDRESYIKTVWPWWRGRHPGRGRWWRIWQSVPAWRWLLSECADAALPSSAQSWGRRKSSLISEGHIQQDTQEIKTRS